MKWWLGVGGAALGLLAAAGMLVVMFFAASAMPGRSELVMVLRIACVLVALPAVGGFVVGCLIDLGARKRR